MNKLIGTLLVFLLFSSIVYSQRKLNVRVNLGPNASCLNYKNIDGSNIFKWGNGAYLNLPIDYNFISILGIEIQPGFTLLRPKSETSIENTQYRFSYFSLPVYLKLSPINRLNLFFGIDMAYMCTVSAKVGSNITNVYDTYDNHS